MEVDKYYTPEIEEFHIGFEVEFSYDKTNYKKQIYDGSQVLKSKSYYDDHGCEYDAVEDDLKYFRVKYLDKEDIESLGFKHIGGKLSSFGQQIFELKKEEGFNTGISYKIYYVNSLQDIEIEIEYWGSYSSGKNKLQFKIKNKSELKRLLKQLNIL